MVNSCMRVSLELTRNLASGESVDVIMANVNVCAVMLALLIGSVISKVRCSNLSSVLSETNSTTLYFGLMLSLSGDDESSGALAGVQAALDEINSRDDLLPGYSLHYPLTDSKVKKTHSISYMSCLSKREISSHFLCISGRR